MNKASHRRPRAVERWTTLFSFQKLLRTLRGAEEPFLSNILSLSDPDGVFLDYTLIDN